jgi:hypothetical protein
MRLLGLSLVVACGSGASAPVQPVDRCDPVASSTVQHRTEAGFVRIEHHFTPARCQGQGKEQVSLIARIALPSPPSSCPIGQVALRTWDQGRGVNEVLPTVVQALDPDSRTRLMHAMTDLGPATEAFVIGCPADWLLVETAAHGERPRTQLLVGNQPTNQHPAVSFSEVPTVPAVQTNHVEHAECLGWTEPRAARWVGRSFGTGTMPGPDWLYSLALGRVGDRATLVVEAKSAVKPSRGTARDWQCQAAVRMTGSVEEHGSTSILHLTEDGQPTRRYDVTCVARTVRVAGADAVRVDVPSNQEGCRRHRWMPATTTNRHVLECKGLPPGFHDMFASDEPGLEHLTVDEDDCWDPVDSLRAIAHDGRIAPSR